MIRLFIILLLSSAFILGQDSKHPKNEFQIIFINDAIFQTDKDYTGSIGLAYKLSSIPLTIKYQIDAYTPSKDDLELSEPRTGTHPYAGYGYIGLKYEHLTDGWLLILYTKLGLTGEYSFAQEMQNTIHKIIGDDLFQGWDTQIQNRFGYIFNPCVEYALHYNSVKLSPYLDIEFGNIISQQKLGFRIASLTDKSFNLYATYDLSNVSKNVFLTGFDNYKYAVDIVKTVHQAIVGFEWWQNKFSLLCQTHFKSKEYVEQERINKYATIILSYRL